MASDELTVVPLEPRLAPVLADMFSRCDNNCYCRYFHFGGDKYAWQDRLANHPALNRAELLQAAGQDSEETTGLVALEPTRQKIVGWLKVTPAASLGKLYDQRLYRNLNCLQRNPDGVFTLGCFFIDPDYRGRGLAARLLAAAIELARQLGAKTLEALPRGGAAVSDAELWMGRASTFVAAGFQLVHNFEPYPVFRLEL
jgi:GNAT superfamily N-acetyltransferase